MQIHTRLSNDLLDSARLSLNQLELFLQPCDLVNIVRDTIDDIRSIFPDSWIELRLPIQNRCPIHVDPDRISQVIANYLINALKYAPSSEPVIVELAIEEDNAQVLVRDEGPGISEDILQHIWDPFVRKNSISSQHRAGGNLGLGLYICRSLIELHRVMVGVKSSPSNGSTFWLALPFTEGGLT
jgi:signal transduction histidine kinase